MSHLQPCGEPHIDKGGCNWKAMFIVILAAIMQCMLQQMYSSWMLSPALTLLP